MTEALFGPDPLDEVVAELRRVPGWPADDRRDREFVAELQQKYPGVSLKDEAFHWKTWMEDNKPKKEVKPRARFLTWVRNSATFRSEREAGRKNRTHQSRTAPARAEQFGTESSTALGGW